MEEITDRKIPYYPVDLLNREALKEVFTKVSCNLVETTTTTSTGTIFMLWVKFDFRLILI